MHLAINIDYKCLVGASNPFRDHLKTVQMNFVNSYWDQIVVAKGHNILNGGYSNDLESKWCFIMAIGLILLSSLPCLKIILLVSITETKFIWMVFR